jgi:hypothetical protein
MSFPIAVPAGFMPAGFYVKMNLLFVNICGCDVNNHSRLRSFTYGSIKIYVKFIDNYHGI